VAFSLRCAFSAHFAVFACALQAWLGSCEHPQQSTHTEPLSSPSERHSHNEDMRPVDHDPHDRYVTDLNISAIPLLKLVAPLRNDGVERSFFQAMHTLRRRDEFNCICGAVVNAGTAELWRFKSTLAFLRIWEFHFSANNEQNNLVVHS